jgi:sugar/nucleoside kinase (ribokinase family)
MARRICRVVAVGDAIVDRITPPMRPLPRGDFQGHIDAFETLPGGNATNFALQIARLGAKTAFVGVLGRDANADLLREAYRRQGVRAIVRTDAAHPTGATVALSWTGGGRALITSLGANGELRLQDIPAKILNRFDHLHRAGFWWTPRLMGRPTALLLSRARRAGVGTSLDMSTDPFGWTPARIRAARMAVPFVDTFFGNEVEVSALGGDRSPFEAARRICAMGAGEVVIHRGDRGSAWISPDRIEKVPAFSVPIENPTGCGDVFNAAYVYARFGGDSVPEALRFANACSALHIRDRRHPYSRLADVRRFLASRFTGS